MREATICRQLLSKSDGIRTFRNAGSEWRGKLIWPYLPDGPLLGIAPFRLVVQGAAAGRNRPKRPNLKRLRVARPDRMLGGQVDGASLIKCPNCWTSRGITRNHRPGRVRDGTE